MFGSDFIVFSDDWGRHPFSCQHIMEQFLPHNRVLWVNTIGLRTPRLCLYDLKRSLGKLTSWILPKGEKGELHPNLRIVAPFMVPYNTVAPVRAYNRFRVVHSVRAAMKAWGIENPVFLATLPNAADYVGFFGESLVVYYCVDDFTLWPGMNQPKMVQGLEADLLDKADLVIAVSDTLCATRANGRTQTRLLTHGVDIEHFMLSGCTGSPPEAMRDLSGPVIGYYGLIDGRMDQNLIRSILVAHPEWHLVLIGKSLVSLKEFSAYPNFLHIPAVPYTDLPCYAACFDVAILPYHVDERTMSINPLKLKEYLASGKPVVSTMLPEVCSLSAVVCTAGDAASFVREIELALQQGQPEACAELLRGESWAAKAELMSEWMVESMRTKRIARRTEV